MGHVKTVVVAHDAVKLFGLDIFPLKSERSFSGLSARISFVRLMGRTAKFRIN
jgi:hypothetical protein